VLLTAVAVVCIALWLTWPTLAARWSGLPSPAEIGQFGDMFGALSSLFSMLAFLGVAASLTYQVVSFRQQSKQLEQQRSLLARQQFESTFFELLRRHRDSLSKATIITDAGELPVEGFDGIRRLASSLQEEVLLHSLQWVTLSLENKKIEIDGLFSSHYRRNEDWCGPYFRGLYHFLKFIDLSSPAELKDTYANLLRAELSNSELILLATNCLTPRGRGLFAYVLKFGLLKHLVNSVQFINYATYMRELYPAEALGSQS
jgi:Putative phage abortive infection protein